MPRQKLPAAGGVRLGAKWFLIGCAAGAPADDTLADRHPLGLGVMPSHIRSLCRSSKQSDQICFGVPQAPPEFGIEVSDHRRSRTSFSAPRDFVLSPSALPYSVELVRCRRLGIWTVGEVFVGARDFSSSLDDFVFCAS